MKEATKINDSDALCQILRGNTQLSKQRRDELLRVVQHNVPRAKRTILPNEIEEWMETHIHPERKKGAIGGHITKKECFTTIGTITTYECSICMEEAYVDDDL